MQTQSLAICEAKKAKVRGKKSLDLANGYKKLTRKLSIIKVH